MKQKLMILSIALLSATSVWAAPYTASLTADTFDSTPDAIVTPRGTATATNNVPDIKDAINLLLGTSYAKNENVDFLQHAGADNAWKDLAATGDPSGYTLIGLSAANSNTLRVYDVNTPGTKVDVFGGAFTGYGFVGDGTIDNPFPYAVSPLAPGTNFGWNLKSVTQSGFTSEWDSNPANNADGIDHMLTYYLEDLKGKTVYVQSTGEEPGDGEISLLSDGPKSFQYTFNDPFLIVWEDQELINNGLYSDQDYNDKMFIVDRVVPVPEPMSMALLGGGLLGALSLRRKKNNA